MTIFNAITSQVRQTTWAEFRYYQTVEQQQWEKCRQINVVHSSINKFELCGPSVVLKLPNLRTLVKGVGDGNCLFRCFSS